MTNNYIQNCIYNESTDCLCPVFSIDQIIQKAESNPRERENILVKASFSFLSKTLEFSFNF
jgi:hypothetical protein